MSRKSSRRWPLEPSATSHSQFFIFPECVARVPVFTWGSGGEAVFAKFCVFGRNRPQPSATVRVSAVRLSTVASASGGVQKACQVDCLSPQLYWCLQRRCLCEWSVSPQLCWCLQRRCLWEWSVAPQLYWCPQRRCLCEWSVSPQLYGCLQRRCLWEWSVSPQLYWCLQRRCLWEWSVAPQLYWRLQRRCLCEWSVSQQRVKSECHTRVSCKKCHVWVCYKRVE